MIVKLDKHNIVEIQENSINLKQFSDNRNGNTVIVPFIVSQTFQAYDTALFFVRVSSSTKKDRDTSRGKRIRVRKGENFPSYFVSTIDAVKELYLIFEFQNNSIGEYSVFANVKVYPREKSGEFIPNINYIPVDISSLNLETIEPEKMEKPWEKISSKPLKMRRGRLSKTKVLESSKLHDAAGINERIPGLNLPDGESKKMHSPFSNNDNDEDENKIIYKKPERASLKSAKLYDLSDDQILKRLGLTDAMLERRLKLSDEALMQRLEITDNQLIQRLGLSDKQIQERLGISPEVLFILNLDAERISKEVTTIKTKVQALKNAMYFHEENLQQLDIEGLQKKYTDVDKNFAWAQMRCEQIEKKFANHTEELTRILEGQLEAIEKSQKEIEENIQRLKSSGQGQLRLADETRKIDDTELSSKSTLFYDSMEKAKISAKSLLDIIRQNMLETTRSLQKRFTENQLHNFESMKRINKVLQNLFPNNPTTEEERWINKRIDPVMKKLDKISQYIEFNPKHLLDKLEKIIFHIDSLDFKEIQEEVRKIQMESFEKGPWKSIDPVIFFQNQFDESLEKIRQEYFKEKETAKKSFFQNNKDLDNALNGFIINSVFPFSETEIDEIKDWHKTIDSERAKTSQEIEETRLNILSLANIQEIIVNIGSEKFNSEYHMEEGSENQDLSDCTVIEVLRKGYRIGVLGKVIKKAIVITR